MISFCSFEGVWCFWVELYISFPSYPLQPTNSCFVSLKPISDGIFKPWTTGFSTVTYMELWWSFKDLQNNALNICGHVPLSTNLHQIKSFFFNFIFPALIDNQNNFEISRLIRLAVSGMFLLPYSASLMSFSSFCSYF